MSRQTDALVAEATRYIGVQEHPKNSNKGLEVSYWLREAGVAEGLPWCAAFVYQMGKQALGSSWPLPRTAGCSILASFASKKGILLQAPARGRVFLLWEELHPARYGHTGIVTWSDGVTYKTIEGNTNPGGSREGYGVFERVRRVAPSTRFIDWEAAVSAH